MDLFFEKPLFSKYLEDKVIFKVKNVVKLCEL